MMGERRKFQAAYGEGEQRGLRRYVISHTGVFSDRVAR